MPPGSLLGQADIAELLGVTRQRVSQLVRDDPTFPGSGTGYGTVRFWRTAGVQAWAAMHRPDRPEAGGRFAGEAAAVLRAADDLITASETWFMDAAHIWWAIADGAAGLGLGDAVTSLGITGEEARRLCAGMRGTDERPHRGRRMTPHLQMFLGRAERRARDAGRDRVTTVDLAVGIIDAPRDRVGRRKPHHPDHLLAVLERRGLDIDELRRRLLAVEAEPASASFESVPLRRAAPRGPRRRVPAIQLAPNPLGHDPWTRSPWGAVFARTRDDRSLVVDGEQWFFTTDGDGYFIRSVDGRPVGYRYRIRPKPRMTPTNGFMEVLPMPPVEVADWPDRRFGPSD